MANIAAAVAVALDPAAVRRRTAAAETSVGTEVFAGTVAFAVSAAGSSAVVDVVVVAARRIDAGGNCKQAEHLATGPVGVADSDFAVQVGSRRKARPWVAAAAFGRPR